MKVKVEYGATYVADTVARTVTVNGVKISAGRRIAKVLKIADAKAAQKRFFATDGGDNDCAV